jgi:hypothetical protein
MRTSLALLAVALLMTSSVDLTRAQARRPARPQAQATTYGITRLLGTVVTMHDPPRPVPNARVRVRLPAGDVVAATRANRRGEFTCELSRGGTYYAEVVNDDGRVVAVEDVGESTVTVADGRASSTILRIPVALAGGWPTTAKTILGAASAAGVAAVVGSGVPASPER